MIFKANNDWGNTKIIPGISGVKTFFSDIKTNYFTKQQRFNEADTSAINNYVKKLESLKEKQIIYNKNVSESRLQTNAFNATMTDASKNAQDFVHGLQNGTENLNNMTKASKAAELGMKTLAMAGNMFLMWGVGEVISLVATAIDNYIHHVDNAKEALDSFNSSVKEQQKSFKSQSDWIEENGTKYKELAEGVDEYGHNISLTKDEFSEYNKITSEIADMFPNMVQGYNGQNQAIIKNKGSIEALTKAYKDNQKAYYEKIRSQSGDTFKNFKTESKDDLKKKNSLSNLINNKPGNDLYNAYKNVWFHNNYKKIFDNATYKQLRKEIKEKFAHSDIHGNVTFSDFDFSKLTPELQQKIKDVYATLNTTIDNKSEKVRPILEAYLQGQSSGYGKLNEKAQTAVQTFIQNVDSAFFEKFETEADMESWIKTNVIDPLKKNIDDSDLAIRIQTLFSINEKNYKSYQAYINAVLDIINALANLTDKSGKKIYTKEQIENFKTQFGVGDTDLEGNISGQKKIDTLKDKFKNIKGADKFISSLKEKKIDILYQLEPDKVKSVKDMKDFIEKELKPTTQKANLSLTFDSAWSSLKASDKKSLQKSALDGTFDKESLSDFSELNSLAKEFSLEKVRQEILNTTNLDDRIGQFINDIGNLTSAFTEMQKNGVVSTKTLQGLPEGIRRLKGYTDFRNTVVDPKSSKDAKKSSFESLISEYTSSQQSIKGVTNETRNYVINVLKDVGIVNAEEIVDAQIAYGKITKVVRKVTNEVSQMTKEDADNFLKAANLKGMTNATLANKIGTNTSTLINSLGKEYQKDVNNFINSVKLKLEAQNELTKALKQSWKLEASARITTETRTSNDINGTGSNGHSTYTYDTNSKKYKKWDKQQEKVEKARKALEDAKKQTDANLKQLQKDYKLQQSKLSKIQYKPSTSSSNNKSSKKSKSSDTIDWIARKLTVLQSVIDKTSGKLQNLFSIKGKNNNIDKQIAEYDTLIKADNKAYKAYMKKANKVKLSKKLKEKVRNGDYDITKYDSKTADAINKYQDYIDKVQDAKQAVQENITSIVELNKQKLDNITSYYDTLISKIDATTSKLEAQISLQKSVNSVYGKGEIGSADTYDKLISNTSSNITQYKSEKKAYDSTRKSARNKLKKELKKNGVSKSERKAALVQFDSETKAQIENFDTSIFNAESKLYEYAQSLASLPWDKASATVDKLSSSYDVLNAKLANGTSVDEKNNTLVKMNANLDEQLAEKKDALADDNKNIKDVAKWLNKNSSIKVKSGEIISEKDLYAIRDKYGEDSNQYAKAIEYNNYVSKRDTDKLEYDKSVEENKANKAENAKSKFTNIQNDYQRQLDVISNSADKLNNEMSVLEIKGYKVTSDYYKKLADNSNNTINKAIQQKTELQKSLDESLENGNIQKGTDVYYEMVEAINTVDKSIDEATLSQEQFLQKVRETERELDKSARDAISDLNSEAEFYKDILAYEELYDDNGNLNDAGKATMQLSMVEMSNYIALNNKLKASLEDLDEQYKNGEMGFDEYYTQRKSLLSEQRDAIKGYYDECNAIKTLIENGYNAQKEALSDLISKYTEALDAEKNLHDYEKNIKEKTENIDSIKKRIAALQGNDTEEARQKIQKLTIDLKDAQEDLEETQYEQYLNDQKDILDDLQNDYQTFVEEQLKNVQDLINTLINDASTNTQAVIDKLSSIASIWGTDFVEVNNGLKTSIESASFGSETNQEANAVKIAEKVYDVFKQDETSSPSESENNDSNDEDPDTNSHEKKQEEEANTSQIPIPSTSDIIKAEQDKVAAPGETNVYAEQAKAEAERQSASNEKKNLQKILKGITGEANDTNKPLRKIKPGETSKSALNKKLSADYGVVVKSGTGNHGQKYIDMFAKAIGLIGGDGYGENDEVYQKLKKEYPHLGFSTGGVVGQLNKIATDNGDDGWITVQAKERVLTVRQNDLWEKWTKNLPELVNIADYLPSMSEYMPKIPDMAANMQVQNGGNSVNIGDISYTMEFPNVTDPASMKEAIKQDTSLQDMLRDVTIGQANKGNKLGIMKY